MSYKYKNYVSINTAYSIHHKTNFFGNFGLMTCLFVCVGFFRMQIITTTINPKPARTLTPPTEQPTTSPSEKNAA